MYPDIGNLQNAAVLYGHDLIDDLKCGEGHIFAMHLKESLPGVYRNLTFGNGHTKYEECLAFALDKGIRLFTGEFWYLGNEEFIDDISRASKFLRNKPDQALLQQEGGEHPIPSHSSTRDEPFAL